MARQRGTGGQSLVPEYGAIACLTTRQAEILRLAADGLCGKQIARSLGISLRTVEGHFSGMRRRTGARSDGELVAYGIAAGILAPGPTPRQRYETASRKAIRPGPDGGTGKSPAGGPAPNGHGDAGKCRQTVPEINAGKRSPGRFRHMLIGYALVSAPGQSADHQISALLRAGVDRADIHIDTARGAKSARPALDRVLKALRPGDTVKVTRLDRLSHSLPHLIGVCADLRRRGIGLHVIEQGIDTSTAEGRTMLSMLSVLAEFQGDLIVASTREGLVAARARGRAGGRRPRLTPDQAAQAQRLYDARQKTVQQIADIFNVPRSTVYDHLSRDGTVLRQPKKSPARKDALKRRAEPA